MDGKAALEHAADADAYVSDGEQICQSRGMGKRRSNLWCLMRIQKADVYPEEFRQNHHKYWGKLYKPEDVKVKRLKSSRLNVV